MSEVHPTAVISEGAVIGEGCTIGPYAVIGPQVVLGANNRVAPHVVIEGRTRIGSDNVIYQFASIGAAPQDLKYANENSTLEIGNKNIIREYVTLQPGTSGGGMKTVIGNENLFMACSHVGHDSDIGNQNVFANSAAIAGHVTVGSQVTIGGLCGIHQHVRLGDLCFLGGGAMVVKDVPPYCIAQGDRAGLSGINQVGLERRGFSANQIRSLRSAYREVFMGEGKFETRLQNTREQCSERSTAFFLEFMLASTRGVTMPRSKAAADSDSI